MSPEDERSEAVDAFRGFLVAAAIAAGIWAVLAAGVAAVVLSTSH